MEKYYPKISIVTPSYNQSQFLEQTIDSVLSQNYPNLEYFVIDGGSTDGSMEIIKRYEKYLAYWVSEKDRGQSHAINKGFARCTGDIWAWLNSDDTYLPSTFATVIDAFREYPEMGMIYGDVILMDENNNIIMEKREIEFDYLMGCCIGFGRVIYQPAAFWKRDVYVKIGGVNEDLYYSMDNDYWLKIAQHFSIKHIDHFLAKARWHENTKTQEMNLQNPRFKKEYYQSLEESFQTLKLAKFMSFRFFNLIRRIYPLKRFMIRLISGYYNNIFKDYKYVLKRNL